MSAPAEMKAWRAHAYGAESNPADTISKMTLETVPVPQPRAGQVLIKVELASVNQIDWKVFSGGMHGICPVTFPYTPGLDIAGTVSKVGEGVSEFAEGDEVIANIGLLETCCNDPPCGPAGAFAEYAVALADTVAKRQGLPATDLVGLPLVGLTSFQALFTGANKSTGGEDLGKVAAGSKLLVLGGASATGMLAIQMAKAVGAHVATTASPNKMPDGTTKIEYMKSVGADEVVNYKEADWSEALAGKDFDQIYDCVGDVADWEKASKILRKGGQFVSIANFSGPSSTADHSFKVFLAKSSGQDLRECVKFVVENKLKVPVDSVTPFDKVPEALTKSMASTSAGKLLIQVS